MKYLILVSIFLCSLGCAGQVKLIDENGNKIPDSNYLKQTKIILTPPLYGVMNPDSSVTYSLRLSAADFVVINDALANRPVTPPISTPDWLQAATSTEGQRVFNFINVPLLIYDYDIYKNRLLLEPLVDYVTIGNIVTLTAPVQVGTRIIYKRRK